MIGRNDDCWCGSNKKYKRCHLARDVASGIERPAQQAPRVVKTAGETAAMRRAGQANGELMDYIRPHVRPGVSSAHIDQLVREYTLDHGYVPACLGYHDFPCSCCISVNDVVCHGIPSDTQILAEGDIVNVDLTTIVDGFYADSSETFMLGAVAAPARELVLLSAQALLRGIAAVSAGRPLRDIAAAIEPFTRSHGCSVVRQYTGHGIGRAFHEHYSVYHHVSRSDEQMMPMQPAMTFTIEPMINRGDYRVATDAVDGWTVRTRDGKLSAQFEHTVLVTDTGAEVLTLTPSQRAANALLLVDGMRIG